MHPLADVLRNAMHGHFPPGDGRVERLPTWRGGVEAVVALTGHAYLCLEVGHDVPTTVADLAGDAFGGAVDPRVVATLAGPSAGRDDIDSLDLIMVAPARRRDAVDLDLVESPGHAHPRVEFARRLRDDVRVMTAPGVEGLLVVASGLAGLTEVSIELAPQRRGRGTGAAMLSAARSLARPGEPIVAAVAPGNAASIRALLAAGFVPVGSVQIWHRGAT